MATIELKTKINAPIERCFLLSLSVDLHQLSTEETNERAISGVTAGLMKLNDVVTWRAELSFQNEEKQKRASELIIANRELAFQNKEKGKRADELILANKELAFQNEEKEKRATELTIANNEFIKQKKNNKGQPSLFIYQSD